MIFCLISYDVVDDPRRTRIHDLLRNHGRRVQKSVFECMLPDRNLIDLQAKLSRMLDPGVDSLRIYRLCKKCLINVEELGCGSTPDDGGNLPVIV